MASDKKMRPTPPPSGPALVPAVGALLLSLSVPACGDDDGSTETGNDSANTASDTGSDTRDVAEGPMPAPTTDFPPMDPPGTTTSGPSESSEEGPMPNPTDTEGTTTSGDDSGSTTAIPPMPPPGSTSE